MSAVLPPKKPSRQPIKLSLPVKSSPPPSSSGSSSTSPLASQHPPNTAAAASTGAGGSGSSSGGGGKPSLRLPNLAGLSLNENSGGSFAGSNHSGPQSQSTPRSRTSTGSATSPSDAYDTDGGETKWAKGDHERITGDILNVIHGGATPSKAGTSTPAEHALDEPASATLLSSLSATTPGTANTTAAAASSSSSSSSAAVMGRPGTAGSVASNSGHSTTGTAPGGSFVFARRRGDGSNDDEVEFDRDQFEDLGKIGEGTSGTVRKVRHKPTGFVMAKKTIPTSPNPKTHKQHLRELLFMRDCRNPHIVEYYGAFLEDHDTSIGICMEYCAGGSLDNLYRRVKANGWRTGEKVLSKIAESILNGLVYLHSLKIIHRDIKPSNVLVSGDGIVKLCDFGVSGELINSLAGTFVGTTFYLSPERIRGHQYSINSDVWSMGLTVLEVALNRFPFPAEGEPALNGPIELLTYLSTMESTTLDILHDEPENGIKYTKAFRHFVNVCLETDPTKRPSPQKLLTHAWVRRSIERDPPTSISKWVDDITNAPV